jgi:uncharacterized protein
MSLPEALSEEKCVELLRGAIVGRVAFVTPEGPRIVPVNYTTVADAVVFRTEPDTLLGAHVAGIPIAFEIDQLDYSDQKGWSVVATGVAEIVDAAAELGETTAMSKPKPWAGGDRSLYVRLPWTEVTGRRLGGGWTHDNELPVRRR